MNASRLECLPLHKLELRLRDLDDYPRDATARLMSRSDEAVRGPERRALRRMQATLATPPLLHLPAKLATYVYQGQNGQAETGAEGSNPLTTRCRLPY